MYFLWPPVAFRPNRSSPIAYVRCRSLEMFLFFPIGAFQRSAQFPPPSSGLSVFPRPPLRYELSPANFLYFSGRQALLSHQCPVPCCSTPFFSRVEFYQFFVSGLERLILGQCFPLSLFLCQRLPRIKNVLTFSSDGNFPPPFIPTRPVFGEEFLLYNSGEVLPSSVLASFFAPFSIPSVFDVRE